LIKAAKEERYYPELEAQLSDLKKRIENSKTTDLVRFKKEISEVLRAANCFSLRACRRRGGGYAIAG
jgi:carboxyl-terminal processing protease